MRKARSLEYLDPEENSAFLDAYNRLFPEIASFVKAEQVDAEKTVYLLKAAMGPRNIENFAKQTGNTKVTVSRILRGNQKNVGSDILVRFAAGADADSGVDLDMLMEAQGYLRRERLARIQQEYTGDCIRIVTDDLLLQGRQVKMLSVDYSTNPKGLIAFSVSILDPESRERYPHLYMVLSCRNRTKFDLFRDAVRNWYETVQNGKFEGKVSLIVDNKEIFDQIIVELSEAQFSTDSSVLLLSHHRKIILEEYSLTTGPEENGKCHPGRSAELFTWEKFSDISLRQMLADGLISKGYELQYVPDGSSYPDVKNSFMIDSHLKMILITPRGERLTWAFTFGRFTETTDNNVIASEFHKWLIHAMAYYYQGGRLKKITLVVCQENIYNGIVRELSGISIPNTISIMLISRKTEKIVSEYIIPSI